MACSSIIERGSSNNSSLTQTRNYDVFISFRGEDTRYNITDILFGALQGNGIFAFRDDKNLPKGESIAPELLLAIEGSQVFVVIFSKNYASSTWCLRELEKIVESSQVIGKHIIPIFYDVDPSDVRHQKGRFDEAFKKHEESFKHDLQIVRRWREVLTNAANLSGFDLRDKPQYVETQKIVQAIINILGYKLSSFLSNDIVGIHTPIEELEKLLRLDSTDDVRVLGISGMGGIGKTTLARVLYGRIAHQFNACCYIDDLSRVYKHDGLIGAQKQILCQTQGGEHLQVWNVHDGTNLMRNRLRYGRALIILDNVDKVEQLQKLGVNRQWLVKGSRIIIISRNSHILEEYEVDVVYKVPFLNVSDSHQLFCQKAFKLDNIMTIHEEVASEILYYANGLPLAIEVLGSFLYGRNISEWKSALARLRESPNKGIMDVLRLSFDGLEKNEKEIFLDIACFFNGYTSNIVRNILNSCGFHPDIGLRVLIDKSLITIREGYFIHMHRLLQELGRNIVHENSIKEPRKWSRLWFQKHLHNVMSENMEEKVEAVVLYKTEVTEFIAESFSKMSHLRLLILKNLKSSIIKKNFKFLESFTFNSSQLRYVEWDGYPFMHLPPSFHPNQLVELILRYSSIKILWDDKKYLPNLRTLDLCYSKNLIEMPNFGDIPYLEELHLEGCVKLLDMDPSIGILTKLVVLNLKDCENLTSIPNSIFRVNSLKEVNLSGCSKLLNNLWVVEMPSSIMKSTMLPSFSCFSGLRQLDISFCCVTKVPDSIGCLCCLEKLVLRRNNFVTIPSLKKLSKLVYLDMQYCQRLKSLPELPSPTTIERDNHIFSVMPPHHRSLGLYFFNCPELCVSKRFDMMPLLWMKQFIEANQDPCDCFGHFDIVIPGSETPSGFNTVRFENNFPIMVDLSPIIQETNNFIGIVLYVALTTEPWETWYENATMWIQFDDKTIYFNEGYFLNDIDIVWVYESYMWLCYISPKSLLDSLRRHRIIIRMQAGSSSKYIKVKEFGYRWVFKKDLQHQKHMFMTIEDETHPQLQEGLHINE